jgi:hypothetical protein
MYQGGGQEHAFCQLQRIVAAAANSPLGYSIPDMTLDCIEQGTFELESAQES